MQETGETLSRRAGELATVPVTVDSSALVSDVARLMKARGVTCVIVASKDPSAPTGIVTERDVIYRILADGRSPYKVTVDEIMSCPLVQVDEETPVSEAVAIMRRRNILRVGVTKDGRITGLLDLRTVFGRESSTS